MSLIGAAAIGAGASLLGNIFGASSTKSANATNLRIAQLNNEFNERMLQKQMDYNTEMWNKENEYNSATQQRQRLEDAGLNPYLMMQGGNAGTAGSVGGVNPPTAQPVHVNPSQFDFSGIGQASQNYMQLKEQQRLNDANIDHVRADARLKGIQQMTILMDAYANARTSEARAALDDTMRETNKMMQGINYKNAEQDLQQKTINNLILSKELSIFDEKNRVMLGNRIADTLLKTEHMKMSKQQRIHEIQKMIKTTAETQGIKISNDVAKRSANSIVDKAYAESYSSMNPFGFLLHVLDNN